MGAEPSARQRLVQAGDITIEAFDFGDDAGDQTVILAAGNGRPATQLAALASSLAADGIRTVTYNYRGIGASTGLVDGLTLHDLAADVWAIADSLELGRVHVAGKTYGNRVMRTAASDNPDRVASIILIGAGGQVPPSADTRSLYARYVDPSTSRQEWIELNAALMYAHGNEHVAAQGADLGTFPEVARAQIMASDPTPEDDWVGGGTAPVLVLVGLEDRVAPPANGLQLATTRANTWLIGIPNCGHNMLDEQPLTLSREVAAFIRRN